MKPGCRILICLLLSSVFTCGAGGNSVLKTRYLEVVYPPDLSQAALVIASDAESIIMKILDFMEYRPRERVRLDITDYAGSFFVLTGTRNHEPNTACYNDELYSIVYDAFIKSFIKENCRGPFPGILQGKNLFLNYHLKEYIRSGLDDNTVMMLNDYLSCNPGAAVVIDSLAESAGYTDMLLMKFFIGYVENKFGRETVACALKDIFYYGNFFTAVSAIAGIKPAVLRDEFSEYIGKFRKPGSGEKFTPVFVNAATDAFESIDQYCSSATRETAFLVKKDSAYMVFMSGYDGGIAASIQLPATATCYTSISMSAGKIYLCGRNSSGSILLCIDIAGRSVEWQREFPFICLESAVPGSAENELYCVITGKGESLIYSYNYVSGKMIRMTDSPYCYDPAVTSSGEIIYVKMDRNFSLMNYNPVTGEYREIYRTMNILMTPVEYAAGRIIFTEKINGVINICSIDTETGKKVQYTFSNTANINPFYMTDRVYFMHYSNGKFRPVYITVSAE